MYIHVDTEIGTQKFYLYKKSIELFLTNSLKSWQLHAAYNNPTSNWDKA